MLLVNDTPCGFSRHLDLRVPEVASQLWGDCLGCFEKPVLDKEPTKEVINEFHYFVSFFFQTLQDYLSFITCSKIVEFYREILDLLHFLIQINVVFLLCHIFHFTSLIFGAKMALLYITLNPQICTLPLNRFPLQVNTPLVG